MAYHPLLFITEIVKPGVKNFMHFSVMLFVTKKMCRCAVEFHYYVVARGTDVA
jgi:hypothetical protein